jgi:hypothetical protein
MRPAIAAATIALVLEACSSSGTAGPKGEPGLLVRRVLPGRGVTGPRAGFRAHWPGRAPEASGTIARRH